MALALGHPVDVGLQAMPRYDAGGRLKEKWLPNQVNTRYNYTRDNTLTQWSIVRSWPPSSASSMGSRRRGNDKLAI